MAFQSLIRKLHHAFCTPDATPAKKDEALRLATAALLLEIAHADNEVSHPERENMQAWLEQTYSLDEAGAKQLIDAAEEVRARTIDHWALAQFLRENTTLQQRIDIVRTMWRIGFADGVLRDYENYLVRKIADLLGLEHDIMIDAKLAEMPHRD